MFRLKRNVISIFFFCLGFAIGVRADDLVRPNWRGRDGTTYQQWTFNDNDNPAAPEVIDNRYGSANATITIGLYGSGWFNQLPGLGTQTGYWDLGLKGGSIVIDIDNQPQIMPQKEIWVQVTYFKDIHQAPIVQIPGATYISSQTVLVEQVPTGGDWFIDQSIWRIRPSVNHEQIIVNTEPTWASLIDQIVVDTYTGAGKCIVALDDLSNFCDQWLMQGTDLEADLDGDKNVDFDDFAIFAALWLKPCPPDWPWQ